VDYVAYSSCIYANFLVTYLYHSILVVFFILSIFPLHFQGYVYASIPLAFTRSPFLVESDLLLSSGSINSY